MGLLQLLKTNVKLVIAVLITASVAGYITSWTKQSEIDKYIEEYEQFDSRPLSELSYSEQFQGPYRDSSLLPLRFHEA